MLLVAAVLLWQPSNGQASIQRNGETIYTEVERQPEFPGGKRALSMYLMKNVKYPSVLSKTNYDPGKIIVRFVVAKNGVVRNVEISSKPAAAEAQQSLQNYLASILNAIEKMPRWRPAEVNGERVASLYILPVQVYVN
ncbi:hypothetical protein DYU11_29155 [Fibrisoma montanum]|uniref:TonB C-terminal domain-containing protein n=1 Tax=Fibrisoma montanum TaxID=2305895 RepID=A0A418LYL8_9BACT|nr:hypothetical protein DYU11_29155 [Fibrisoma montanum]